MIYNKNIRFVKILAATKERIQRQRMLPMSPGLTVQGQRLLCAAACLVREGLALTRSEHAAKLFESQIVQKGSSDDVVAASKSAGLESEFVQQMLSLNDSVCEHDRVNKVFQLIDERTAHLAAS